MPFFIPDFIDYEILKSWAPYSCFLGAYYFSPAIWGGERGGESAIFSGGTLFQGQAYLERWYSKGAHISLGISSALTPKILPERWLRPV